MGKEKHLDSKGKLDLRIVFDQEESDFLREISPIEDRTLVAQVRHIVKQARLTKERNDNDQNN